MLFIKFLLATSLCISSSIEAIAIHFVNKSNIHANPEQLIIFSELTKLIISLLLFYSFKTNDEDINFKSIQWFSVPALMYMISNNITYIALFYLKPAMFNLLTNFKIPITIFLAFIFLHRRTFNIYQLFTVLLISSGNTLAFVSGSLTDGVNYKGVFYMLIYSLCSGTAAVYSEFVMKIKFNDENVFLQNVKFCICSIFSNLLLTIMLGNLFDWYLQPIHLLSIFSMAINGIMTGLVLKFSGSIVKTYSTSFSVVLSIISTYIIWGYDITVYFIVGSIISYIGINIFLYDKYKTYYKKRYNGYSEINDDNEEIILNQ